MWAIVIAALGGLAILIIIALSVPVDASVYLNMPGKPWFQLKIRWLFGLVEKEIRGGKVKKEKPPEKPAKVKKGKPIRRARVFLRVLRTEGLIRQLITLMKELFGCFKVSRLAVSLRIGLDNPADTGILFGFIEPARVLLPSPFSREINIQPDFQDAVLEGYLHGTVTLQPIRLVPPIFRFIFSLPVLRAVKRVMSAGVQQRRKS